MISIPSITPTSGSAYSLCEVGAKSYTKISEYLAQVTTNRVAAVAYLDGVLNRTYPISTGTAGCDGRTEDPSVIALSNITLSLSASALGCQPRYILQCQRCIASSVGPLLLPGL